jgi:hypothetical protein
LAVAVVVLVKWFPQAEGRAVVVDFQLVVVDLLVQQAKEITAAVMRTPQILTAAAAVAVRVQWAAMQVLAFQALVAQALPLQLLVHQ